MELKDTGVSRVRDNPLEFLRLREFYKRPNYMPTIKKKKCSKCGRLKIVKTNDKINCSFCKVKIKPNDKKELRKKRHEEACNNMVKKINESNE